MAVRRHQLIPRPPGLDRNPMRRSLRWDSGSLGIGYFFLIMSNSDRSDVQLSRLMLLIPIFFSRSFLPLASFEMFMKPLIHAIPLTQPIQRSQSILPKGEAPTGSSGRSLPS